MAVSGWRSGLGVAVTLVVLVLFGAACSSGGGGNTGSDADTKQERTGIDQSAHADLEAALGRVQPCSSDVKQIGDVLEPYGKLQQIGRSTASDKTHVRDALAPAARSVARAVTRGETVISDGKKMTGMDADTLAKSFGIDTNVDGWMDDEQCEKNWTVLYRQDVDQIGADSGKLIVEASIPITIAAGGVVSGTGPLAAKFGATVGPCEITAPPIVASISMGGKLGNGTFSLLVSYASFTFVTTTSCTFPPPVGVISNTTPITIPGITNFPITVAAKGGATGSDDRAHITVTMLRRP